MKVFLTSSYFINLCISLHALLPIVEIPNDYRTRHSFAKFPILFHYDCDGYVSGGSDCVVEELPYETLPQQVLNILDKERVSRENTSVYFAEAHFLMHNVVNYFAHCWAMTFMTKNCEVFVKTGIFESSNIASINNEIGINCLVEQKLIFHDGEALSPNTARFHVIDKTKDSTGLFVSISKFRAIVVLWQLPPVVL